MRYHVNPATGAVGACRAKYGCPYGGDHAHGDSADEARAKYEARMASNAAALERLQASAGVLEDADFTQPVFFVRERDWNTTCFSTLAEAVDHAERGGGLEIIGVTEAANLDLTPPAFESEYQAGNAYESIIGEWEFLDTPHYDDLTRLEEKLAVEYFNEEYDRWSTGWYNPDEANGMCTDSAESFVEWANERGIDAYVLDMNRDGGPHTVSVVRTERGERVVDFTYRQFDPTCTVPYFEDKDMFLEDGEWSVTDTYRMD